MRHWSAELLPFSCDTSCYWTSESTNFFCRDPVLIGLDPELVVGLSCRLGERGALLLMRWHLGIVFSRPRREFAPDSRFSFAFSQPVLHKTVRQDRTLGAIKHSLYAPGGTNSVPALAVARRQHEIIGNSLYVSASMEGRKVCQRAG
jgi:hypothetical protein